MVTLNNPYNKLDFINVRDIAKYFIKIINNNTQSGIYNIGSGKSTSIIQIFNFVKKILNKPKAKFSYTNQKQINFYSNTYKSRKLISFTPKINMFDGIKQQLKVLKS
jgi:nucleoside-diphosphate-sugar epimerase